MHWPKIIKRYNVGPMFQELKQKISEMFYTHINLIQLSIVVHKCVYIPISEHFSFANVIHPPDNVAYQEAD
jgi:hypothetical protein